MNSWVLWDVGRLVERFVGNAGLLIVYLVSGLAGSMASLMWNAGAVSAGASGAIFGLFGVLLGFTVRGRGSIPAEKLRDLRSSGLGFLLFNLVFGMTVQGIDLAAHLGGLATGIACGLISSPRLLPENRARRAFFNFAIGGVGIALFAAFPFFAPKPPGDLWKAIGELRKAEEAIISRFNETLEKVRTGRTPDAELVDLLDRELLPRWRAARERFESLPAPAPAQAPPFNRLKRYLELRQESWELLVEGVRRNDPEKVT